jgi:ankyrin repeat protein
VNHALDNGATYLFMGIKEGCYNIIRELLKRRADRKAATKCLDNHVDTTPFQVAKRMGQEEVIDLFRS